MDEVQAEFSPGELVALRADPLRVGPVVDVLSPVNGRFRYRVFHSTQDIREYDEDQLVPAGQRAVEKAPEFSDLRSSIGMDADAFRARVTATRLRQPDIEALYALHAARIRFIPFQFKPLVRFIRTDSPRLLIADEVGVGKTIEAGLVMQELKSRQEVTSVVIVCPKALVFKWHAEMKRFDEEFEILDTNALTYCIRTTSLEGVWPARHAYAIIPLELARQERILYGRPQDKRPRPGIATLVPGPRFDLLIIDEAHHVANPGTNSRDLARCLCDAAENVLFLTATPIQVGSENLFSLLNLLRPDTFLDLQTFHDLVEPNVHINQAIRLIRAAPSGQAWQGESMEALVRAGSTTWGRSTLQRDPRFADWLERLGSDTPLSNDERVRCVRDLEEVHTLAFVMNRTRRRDIGAFTLRDPHTVAVPFSPEQEAVYRELIALRQEILRQHYDEGIVRLISVMLERQAASCLPALAGAIRLVVGVGDTSAGLSDISDDAEDSVTLPHELLARLEGLEELAARLPAYDPKAERLQAIVQAAMAPGRPGKVLVFSFFLRTLEYLLRQLRSAGYRVAVVNGQVPDDQREHIRNAFRLDRSDPDAIDVLLSSEVGCEGLDYEFCDELVNYDIPWNPMRIEQRIGRIDRFGQRSPKVLIQNFITPGTVEERIFFRCYERLGVFRSVVGDLEEVLGDLVAELNRTATDPSLTPEQAEARAKQLADNTIRQIEESRRLEEESKALLGLDSVVADPNLEHGNRLIGPEDLRAMVEHVLKRDFGAALVHPGDAVAHEWRLRIGREGRERLRAALSMERRRDPALQQLLHFLDTDDTGFRITFEQDDAMWHRDWAFVTPVHPLARLAAQAMASDPVPFSAALITADDKLAPGVYAFTLYLWDTIAYRTETRLQPVCLNVADHRPAPEVEERLLGLLSAARSAGPAAAPCQRLSLAQSGTAWTRPNRSGAPQPCGSCSCGTDGWLTKS